MSGPNLVKIGKDMIDIDKPCDVLAALKKMQLSLAVGGVRQSVRIDDEEVVFQRADDNRLEKLITKYSSECARLSGSGIRTRYAKRFRYS